MRRPTGINPRRQLLGILLVGLVATCLAYSAVLQRPRYAPGEYNVKFLSTVGAAARLSVSALFKSTNARVISEIPQIGVKTLILPKSAMAPSGPGD